MTAKPVDTIKLPPGFSIAIYAGNVPNARGMTLGQGGTLFVGTKDKGDVYAVLDKDGDPHEIVVRIIQIPDKFWHQFFFQSPTKIEFIAF